MHALATAAPAGGAPLRAARGSLVMIYWRWRRDRDEVDRFAGHRPSDRVRPDGANERWCPRCRRVGRGRAGHVRGELEGFEDQRRICAPASAADRGADGTPVRYWVL